MNRFFRTAYSTTLVYLSLTMLGVLITGVSMPFLAFSSLYFGLLLFLLPDMSQKLAEKEVLFYVIGSMTAVLGFLPIALGHCPIIHWLIHLLAITAAGVFLSSLQPRTTHRLFLAKFRFTVVSLVILIGLVCFIMQTDIFGGRGSSVRREAVNLALNSVVPYAIVLLASGVLLLRGLLAQPGRMVDEQAFNRRQLRDVLIFAILVTLVFAVDPFAYLENAIAFLLHDVLRPSVRFLARLFGALLQSGSFGKQPMGKLLPTEEGVGLKPLPRSELAEATAEYNYHNYLNDIEENDLLSAFDYVCLAAAVLIFLAVLAWQIYKLAQSLRKRSRDRGSGYPDETCEMLPMKKGKSRERKRKRRNSDPREQIRYLYGGFLRYLHKRGVQFGRTNTCGEIRHDAEKQSAADPSLLSDFTVLYEKARYRMTEMPTETDAQVMKDLLDRIKKNMQS